MIVSVPPPSTLLIGFPNHHPAVHSPAVIITCECIASSPLSCRQVWNVPQRYVTFMTLDILQRASRRPSQFVSSRRAQLGGSFDTQVVSRIIAQPSGKRRLNTIMIGWLNSNWRRWYDMEGYLVGSAARSAEQIICLVHCPVKVVYAAGWLWRTMMGRRSYRGNFMDSFILHCN